MLQLRPTSGKKNLISSKTSSKVREKSNSQINKSWRSLLSLTCPTRYAQWSPTSRNERILYSNSKPYGGIKISVNIFRSRETYQGAILEELHLKSFNYNWTDLGNKTVVVQLCPPLWNPMNCSTAGFPVHHQLPELSQTHVHWVDDAIQLSHPLLSPSPPAFNLSQHQGLFQWIGSSHQVTKVLKLQLQHQSFQWIFRTDFL